MSLRLFPGDVLFTQRLLRAQTLYGGRLDGRWGPLTEAASAEFERRAALIREQTRTFDARSEAQLAGLLLPAQRLARTSLARMLDAGSRPRLLSGTRGYAEQNALFRRGRYGNPGPVVTNARGGQSMHNFGTAWDIGLFDAQGRYLQAVTAYDEAARVGLVAGLEWGGDSTRFVDRPHYQLRLGWPVAEVRRRFEAGRAYLPADDQTGA
ncbi:M15 family metallopeptidase [Lysobacter sp. TAF61]|uniref:M15 family metallopeptidase n=1 Tax=Lysobacter sp. TAF61 TaxID=3233072 RepID=UPI003F9A4E91